jgi:uncharacterized iron-regulated protein
MTAFKTTYALFVSCLILLSCTTSGKPSGIYVAPNCAQQLGDSERFKRTSEKLDYRIYDSSGSEAALCTLIQSIKNSNVTFLGEIHTDSVAHALEVLLLEMTFDENLTLSLEMFETDVQFVLDEYLAGLINEEHFLKSSRAWENYNSDYRALVEFSKNNNVNIIAANAPGRYVNMVSRLGKDSLWALPEETKKFLPPLPYPDASLEYRERFNETMRFHNFTSQVSKSSQEPHGDAMEAGSSEVFQDYLTRFLEAQSLWETSMAWSIASYLRANPEDRVININGSFHTDYSLGIPEHLDKYLPGLETMTISIVPSQQFPEFDESMKNLADFIIVTDAQNQPAD